MAGTDKRKQSLYFPEDMLREIQEEANRQDRSLSWIVQQAWKIARVEIGRLQKRLWERQRKLIAASVLGQNAAFRAYERRYLRATREHLRDAAYAELLEAIAQADVVYVGDYHTLKQAQRSFLKLV